MGGGEEEGILTCFLLEPCDLSLQHPHLLLLGRQRRRRGLAPLLLVLLIVTANIS